MKRHIRTLAAATLIAAGIALIATSPGASSEHFVVTNDSEIQGSNTATVLKLTSPSNLTLSVVKTLVTHSDSGGSGDIPSIQMIQHGADACLFVGDDKAKDISAFVYPTWASAGNYTDPKLSNTYQGIVLAASSSYLFAGYTARNDSNGHIGVWAIGAGCTLKLLGTYAAAGGIAAIAVSPNGNTIVVGYASPASTVGSFSVGSNGQLTEHGPYNYQYIFLYALNVDITADSKYALFGELGYGGENGVLYTQVGIFPINLDGSLGQDHDFGGDGSLGPGAEVGAVRLSPNEKFLFVSDIASGSQQLTTLNFSESVPSVSYGCITTRRNNGNVISLGQIATVMPTGSGSDLFVAESGVPGYVALFTIDPSTGCTTEVPDSPFSTGKFGVALNSLAAWPPRPF